MYDGQKIIVGLLVFIALASIPLWYTPAAGKAYEAPDIKLPEGECVESRDYMRSSHMEVLNDWRDSVVRLGNRIHVFKSGKRYLKTLTGSANPPPVPKGSPLSGVDRRGCLGCHGQVAEPGQSAAESFCVKCHQTAAVEVTCWDCHHESDKPVSGMPAASTPGADKSAPSKAAPMKPAVNKGGVR